MAKFSQSLRRPATESDTSLIDQATQAVQSQGSTDPTVIDDNAQFEAEIQRLKAATAKEQGTGDAPAGDGADPAANPDSAGGAADPGTSDPAPADTPAEPQEPTEDDNKDGDKPTEDAPQDDDTDAEPEPVPEDSADQAAAEVANEPVDENADLEKAADKDLSSEERKAAVESFYAVREQYETMLRVHEQGRIGAVHIGLCSATMGSAARRHRLEAVSFATESGDGILARIAEFVRQLIARMKAAFSSLFNWFRDFLRGYKAATGKYASNRQGVADRIKFLKDSGVTINDAMIKGKKVKVAGLSNVYGGEVAEVNRALGDLQRFATTVFSCLSKPEVPTAFEVAIVLCEKFAAAGSASFASDIPMKPVSAELVFGTLGQLSKLGDSSFIRDNVKLQENETGSLFSVDQLIGGSLFSWWMEPNVTSMPLQQRAETIRRIDFRATRKPATDFEVQALTPAQVEVFLEMADAFVKLADNIVDGMAAQAKQTEGLKNKSLAALQAVAKHAQEQTITEQESFMFASIISTAPDAHARFAIATSAKLVDLLRRTADEITNWCILSSKVIDEVTKKA